MRAIFRDMLATAPLLTGSEIDECFRGWATCNGDFIQPNHVRLIAVADQVLLGRNGTTEPQLSGSRPTLPVALERERRRVQCRSPSEVCEERP